MDAARDGLYQQLQRKKELLDRAVTNTEIQLRFIRQRKLKGLQRLLDERSSYLQELVAINERLEAGTARQEACAAQIRVLLDSIGAAERELAALNEEELGLAREERQHIIDDLQRVRAGRHIRDGYDVQWIPTAGNRINSQG